MMRNVALPRVEIRREIVIRRPPRRGRGRDRGAALRIPVPARVPTLPRRLPTLPRRLPTLPRLPAAPRVPVPAAIPVPVRMPAPVPIRRPVPRWLLIAAGAVALVAVLLAVGSRRRNRGPAAADDTLPAEGAVAGEAALDAARADPPAWFRRFVTTRFNPAVVRLGLVGGRRSPWGYVEHVGRVSGTVRRTPVMARVAGDHVYVPLPYGIDVEWVRNVRTAGHCRLQVHGTVYDLDEPAVITASEHEGLPERARRSRTARGMRYLRLSVLSEVPGDLDAAPADEPDRSAVDREDVPARA